MIEVFTKISNRMLKGLMYHAQWADMFAFIGLNAYANKQNDNYYHESSKLRELHCAALRLCGKLIKDSGEFVNEIPENWYDAKQTDVDPSTIKQATKGVLNKWLEWEKETKTFYEEQYKILFENNKIEESRCVKHLIRDVQEEIERVTAKILELKAVDYDMTYILEDQTRCFGYDNVRPINI